MSAMVYPCKICDKTFSCSSNCFRHLRSMHNIFPETGRGKNVQCRDCDAKFGFISGLRLHLTNQHNFIRLAESEDLLFLNLDDFYDWKRQEEASSNSRWILVDGGRSNKAGNKMQRFYCCRTGKPPGEIPNRKRRMKFTGSRKIGYHCTSMMKVIKKRDVVEVQFFKHHYGHESKVGHLPSSSPLKTTPVSCPPNLLKIAEQLKDLCAVYDQSSRDVMEEVANHMNAAIDLLRLKTTSQRKHVETIEL